MLKVIKKLSLPLGLLLTLWAVVYLTVPPASLSQASPLQLLSFFAPLFLLLTVLVQFLLHHYLKSLAVSLSLVVTLYLYGLAQLNLLTLASLIIFLVIVWLVIKKHSAGFNISQIPKIKLKKQ